VVFKGVDAENAKLYLAGWIPPVACWTSSSTRIAGHYRVVEPDDEDVPHSAVACPRGSAASRRR